MTRRTILLFILSACLASGLNAGTAGQAEDDTADDGSFDYGQLLSGVQVGLGYSAVPTLDGWQSGSNVAFGISLGIERIAVFEPAVIVKSSASYIFGESQPVITELGFGATLRLGYNLPRRNSLSFYPNLVVMPMAVGDTEKSNLLHFGFMAGAGIRVNLGEILAFGLDALSDFSFDLGYARLVAIPVRVYFIY